jgi:hypothetical protein
LGCCLKRRSGYLAGMSKSEILNELPRLTPAERQEIRLRLAELDEENDDSVAFLRAEELKSGQVKPKTQDEVFRNAREALK